MPLDLTNLLPHLPTWLLVFFRLTGLFVIAPLFSSLAVPARIRIGWALALSLCVYPVLLARPESAAALQTVLAHPLSLWTLPFCLAAELALGALMGYLATLPLVGLQLAGLMSDQQLGTGLASVFNPEWSDDEQGVLSQIYFVLGLFLFILLGGDRALVLALLESFRDVPLGSFTVTQSHLLLVAGLLTAAFDIALRVAAPLLCLVFLETVAMGFIARTVPQMNILSIGFPMRILLGLSVLILSLSAQSQTIMAGIRHTLRAILACLGT